MIVKRVLFYSSVKDISLMYIQKFYLLDKIILEQIGYKVTFTNSISDFFKWKKYDIVFVYFYRWGFFPGLIGRFLGKGIYFTGGIDSLDRNYSPLKAFLIQKIFFFLCYIVSTKCFIVSNSDLKNIKQNYKFLSLKKLILSYHGISVRDYYAEKESKRDSYFTTIAWMGKISNVQRKGIDLSLYIFKDLIMKEDFKDFKYYIIGKGGEGSEYLKQIVADLRLQDNVFFLGEILDEKKIAFLQDSYAYFQLSKYEGFGLAALEALAAGNVIIHSGIGGLKDVVSDFGIEVNIYDRDISNISNYIYHSLINFSQERLISSKAYLEENFDIAKRKNDFKININ